MQLLILLTLGVSKTHGSLRATNLVVATFKVWNFIPKKVLSADLANLLKHGLSWSTLDFWPFPSSHPLVVGHKNRYGGGVVRKFLSGRLMDLVCLWHFKLKTGIGTIGIQCSTCINKNNYFVDEWNAGVIASFRNWFQKQYREHWLCQVMTSKSGNPFYWVCRWGRRILMAPMAPWISWLCVFFRASRGIGSLWDLLLHPELTIRFMEGKIWVELARTLNLLDSRHCIQPT